MKKNNILKGAGVLLIVVALVFSSTAAIANTEKNEEKLVIFTEDSIEASSSQIRAVVYDNGMGQAIGMLAAQEEPPSIPNPLQAWPADDFILEQPALIDDVHWQGGYYNCQYAEGAKDYNFDWNITFYDDKGDGTAPGTVIAEFEFTNASVSRDFWYNTTSSTGRESWYANYSVQLLDPLNFDANKKYWISIWGYNATWPQSGWCRHNETVLGIKFHEGVFKSPSFGFPDWTNTSDPSLIGEPNDFNFALTGEELAAPVLDVTLKGGFGLTATITNSGSVDATNVSAEFTISGGLMLLPPGGSKTVAVGTISKEGGTGTAKCMVFGIGKPTVTVDVTCNEGATANATLTPTFVILFFVL